MRAVTLSNDAVLAELKRNFVCGWTNIKGQVSYAGSSNTHMPDNPAIEVTNCAGHHNVQMFFLTSDGKLLHCLPGYWRPADFRHELDLALELGKLYYRTDLTAAQRNSAFLDLHLNHAISHSPGLRSASAFQGFDKQDIQKRGESDFQRSEGFVAEGLKMPDQVLHERLALRPFAPFEDFDVKKLIDMGLRQYKYDYGLPGRGKHGGGGKTSAPSAGGKAPAPSAGRTTSVSSVPRRAH